MTTEEKAKAYDEAIKVAKNELKQDLHESGIWAIKRIFPELAESEDERIRKWLVQYIKDTHPILNYWNGAPTIYDVLAWLEKQKEPQNKSMAHEDCSWTGILTSPLCKDKNLDDIAQEYVEGVKEYNPMPDWNLIHTAVCYGYHLAEQKEQKPRLIGEDSVEKTARQMYETGQTIKEQKPAEWSEKHIAGIFEKVGLAKIVREQGNDDLTNALQDAMLELSKVGNIEWSEEDEEMIERLIRHTQKEFDELCNDRYGHQEIISDLKESCLERMNWLENRLKSLRPQPKQEKSDYITPHKQFFKWIYDRLVSVHKENPDADYMISFKKRIEELSFYNPSWEPSEDEERLIKTSISFLKDFADKGYENAVECIDWLKAKLNGNTCK